VPERRGLIWRFVQRFTTSRMTPWVWSLPFPPWNGGIREVVVCAEGGRSRG
ncbi:unnamed protein product, partial [Didymodactylos carnosus]